MSATFHVVRQGAEIRLKGETLEAWHEDQRIAVARLPLLDALVVHGGVSISTQAITRLLLDGVDCVFLTLDGRFKGRLESFASSASWLRLAQVRAAADSSSALDLARAIVRAKVMSQWRTLRALRGPTDRDLPWAVRRIGTCKSLPELRGAEGFLTRVYFDSLRTGLGAGWASWRRKRRPPPDGLNALLSYGYAILQSRIHAAVATVGLDPHQGFLHESSRPRPALVLDLMEEFRAPVIDFTAVRMVRSLGPSGWWEATAEGARIGGEARNQFLQVLEQRFQSHTWYAPGRERTRLIRVFELQARCIAQVVQGRRIQLNAYGGVPGVRGVRRGL